MTQQDLKFHFKNLIQVLRQRAGEERPAPGYLFLENGEVEAARRSFADLDRRARAIAAQLQQLGLAGERVLLLHPPGLDFVDAFFGCLYAGAVAVPAYPPRSRRGDPRLQAIARDAAPGAALTTSALLAGSGMQRLARERADLTLLATDTVASALAEEWREPELGRDSLAFLQYTSGSTADPKGVKVTHGNLLANQESIRRAFRQDRESVIVGWLPVYHDMGLIGNVLQPLYVGGRCILMSPVAFLQQPRRWLAAIGSYRATTSGGPNFAYDLCLRKIAGAQLEGLDLRSWSLAYNGAEPVRPETLAAFGRRFAPCGFRAAALYPCYGLAEATLFVSGGSAGREPAVRAFEKAGLESGRALPGRPGEDGCRSLAGCGGAAAGHRLLVVDPERREICPAGRIGEIWVSGPSVAQGYWNRPGETAETFGARLREEPAEPWLRTGDLGFLADGELFLTGRLKDLVILRGRNHYPQDLESTAAASHPALRPGGAAAFAVEGAAGEELVLVCEIERGREREADAAGEAVRRALAAEHEVEPRVVLLTPSGEVPKTSSGKLRRSACRTAYLAGELRALGRSEAQTGAGEEVEGPQSPAAPVGLPPDRPELLDALRQSVARAARVSPERIDPGAPLADLALDSLRWIEVQQQLEEALGLPLPLSDLLEADSLAGLADLLLARPIPPTLPTPPALPAPSAWAVGGEPPLSIGQEALWFLDRLAPGNPAYLLAGALALSEPVPAESLEMALAALLARHAALRTTVATGVAGPVQRIHPAAEVPDGWFAEVDAEAWREAELRARLNAEAGRPFDLERDLPLRVRSYRTRTGAQVLLFVFHHIAVDLASAGVLAGELSALLGAAPAELPPLPLTYADYALSQRARMAGPEGERLWSYWQGELGGDLPALDLPLDRPRPPLQTFHGAERLSRLGGGLGGEVRSLAARLGSTPYVVLLSAFSALLWRYGGGDDLLVGAPAAGRRSAELAGLVGYFVNPLALRVRIPGDPPFATLAGAVRRTVLAGLDHQDYPFPLLAQRLQPERDPARPPLYQVLFTLHEIPRAGADLGALALGVEELQTSLGGRPARPLRVEKRGALCDLSLYLAWAGGELVAALEYNTDLWDGASAERLLAGFETLLRGVAAEPPGPLSHLPLLTPAERDQLLGGWSGSQVEAPAPGPALHELFEAQVDRDPEREALVCGEERLSYRDLESRADRLALLLIDRGVGPEVLVGISLPRSIDLVVAVLAVLKAGGAYVPLDPAYPAERRAFQLADSGARLLLRNRAAGSDPAGAAAAATVDLDELAEALAAGRPERPRGRSGPGHLAYVLYTSGSTGTPKGVAVEHRSAVALLRWAADHFAAEELAGVLASTALGFDLSVFELFLPLSRGGRVILAENLLALPTLPAAREVTLVNSVPSAVRELLRSGGLPGGVRTVALAGEALPGDLAQELYGRPGISRVLNLYGPTEDTTYSTWEEVARGSRREPGIGSPLAGTRAYVADPRLAPLPVGVAGELFLGGAGLARGYLDRPDLTASRFLPDPFSAVPGSRLYRTGDRVRWRPEGGLAFLGRLDHQVKVRGFRVEPGEVEAALASHPGVGECAVVARDDGSGSRLLAACIVPDGGALLPGAGLRRFLAERLPAHLVPAVFELLPALPRTPSGKIDRAALSRKRPEPVAASPAPPGHTSPGQSLLAGIWADLLGAGTAGPEDDFFSLGGHSLLAGRLVSRVRDAFRVELTLADVFRFPTLAGLAAHLDGLRRAGVPAPPPLERAPRQSPAAPSPAQRRLWFLDRLAEGEPLYNMPGGFRVEGELDPAALAAALAEVVRRHEALRARFPAPLGEPLLEIRPAAAAGLPLVDLGALAPAQAAAQAARLAAEEARRPFDLAAGPLFRFCLLKESRDRHTVLVTLHHIVADGGSLAVLARELGALYGAFSRGLPSPLAELPVQYADLCHWQSRWLSGGLLAADLAAWRERLQGAPPASELPADRPRPARQSFRGAVLPLAWEAGRGRDLERLSRAAAGTPFLILLAGLAAALNRLSGQEDLVVGAPFANRDTSEAEGLIGLFVNTLPLRLDLAGEPSFGQLLERARGVVLDAHAHRHLPFERLVEEFAPARDLSRSPLFQVLLVADEGAEGRAPLLADCRTGAFSSPTGTAKFDLTLTFGLHRGELGGELEYATDLFDAATLERFAGHLGTLLAEAVAAPERPLADLPLLSRAEARQLAVEWTATASPYPRDRGLHGLFLEQAGRTPEATALVWGDRRLSYGELARRTARLAGALARRGVGPEVPVAILAERTPEMVTALLAVLAAGGVYLPLDPAYPAERLAFLLADSGAALLLAEEHLLDRVPGGAAAVLPLGGLSGSGPAIPPSRRLCHPEQAAYVIYTSGSTGRPKGVVVRHGSAAARVAWALGRYSPEELSGVLASTSICFDLSVFELFVPLSAGGAVLLADDALALAGLPAAGAVTLVNTVPSAAAEWVRAGSLPAAVRTVNLAGEPLRRELVERLHALSPDLAVHNLYGPTEDTIYSTGARMERADPRAPSLGRPLPNSRALVLDRGMRLLPVGTPGELWLGGDGLARGYLGRPELTADRFHPDPFAAAPGSRLYRTGDVARFRPSGELDYLGRSDQQVKVRGYRVELGEVEATLGRFPGLSEVAVAVQESAEGGSRLCAYGVAAAGAEVRPAALHAWTAARLPAYMVPSSWIFLSALPRLPNGKVDRRALPAAEPTPAAAPVAAGGAPWTPVEELLAEIWGQLLGRERVERDDHFFLLGGHSLLAAQVVSRIREALGVDLPVRALFERPTLGALAGAVSEALRAAPSPVLPLSPEPRDGEIPLSFAQERLWFLDQLDPGKAFYNIPVAVRLGGPLDVAVLRGCLAEMVRRQESLRTTFADHGGRPCQVIAAPSPDAPVPCADLSALPAAARDAELASQLAAEARRPFDLARGPLLRTLLFRLSGDDHLLVPTSHHIISDGWSMTVFLRDLAALYEAGLAGRPSPLAPLCLQYADYAIWQRRALVGDVLSAHLAYWREQLAGAPALDLPADRPRPAVEAFRGAQQRLRLPGEMVTALADASRRHGVTPFMTLLAVFQVLLLRMTGQEDLAVGAPIANRGRPELEPLIGFFANTVVLRTRLGGDPSFRELLARVRGVALGAYAHEDLPFEKLVEEIQPERDTSHNPLFQVMCVLQNQPWPELRMGDLTLTPLEIDSGTAKFDLTLFWREEAGELPGLLEYNTDLFDGVTARRLYDHYESLLRAALASPERPLSDLPLLDAAGRHQLLFEWNGAEEPGSGRAVHAWVEEQVARTPDRVAVVHGRRSLTYGELNRRANRLAHGLRQLGAGPEDLVGICVERSIEMTLAMLAVQKAGGAAVALDPAYPLERLAFIIEDARLAVLLTQTRLLDRFPGHRARSVLLDPGADPFPGFPAANPQSGVTLDHPMYAIYTSGSTGQPKGIVVTHRAFANLLLWQFASSGLAAGARTLQFATFGFCVSFQEMFSSWCAGGELVLADEETRRNLDGLGEVLDRYGVERLHLPAAALKHLADAAVGRDRLPGRLREVITAGEQLQVTPAVRQLFARLPGCVLHNQYGASETHVVSALALAGEPRSWPAIPTVGRPIGNVRIHLLDPALRPVPVGVAGELYAGGACLPRCYLNDPVLTAAKLVPDPYGPLPGARLYRTGDAAHYLPDGRIQYHGRIDGQVKIRGFRVELGEIETVLRQLPAVEDAAVVVHAADGGAVRLVAYLVPRGGELRGEEVLAFLKSKLPEYMLPAAFVPLAALPINANGKLDREALPAPAGFQTGRERQFVAPRDPVEELLAEIWGRVLGLPQAGVHDDFFDSGGHSLLATQLISRIRGTFQIDLPLRALFESPNIAGLARALAAREPRPGFCSEIARLVQSIRTMSADTLRLEIASRKAGAPGR